MSISDNRCRQSGVTRLATDGATAFTCRMLLVQITMAVDGTSRQRKVAAARDDESRLDAEVNRN